MVQVVLGHMTLACSLVVSEFLRTKTFCEGEGDILRYHVNSDSCMSPNTWRDMSVAKATRSLLVRVIILFGFNSKHPQWCKNLYQTSL